MRVTNEFEMMQKVKVGLLFWNLIGRNEEKKLRTSR
jgi:hypothetical protein